MNKLGYAVFGALSVVAFGVVAQEVMQLRSFSAGEPIRAADINANFAELERRVALLQAQPRRAVPRVCGVSADTHTGALSRDNARGYAAAAAICRATCGNSPTAHMCTDHEVRLSLQRQGDPPFPGGVEYAWMSGIGLELHGQGVAPSAIRVSDCDGWRSNAATIEGMAQQAPMLWKKPDRTTFSYDGCDQSRPIACCDDAAEP